MLASIQEQAGSHSFVGLRHILTGSKNSKEHRFVARIKSSVCRFDLPFDVSYVGPMVNRSSHHGCFARFGEIGAKELGTTI